MNRIRIIECDIEEKWMILKEKNENDEEWIEISKNEIKKNDVIDLNENGERWEGSSLEGIPFGYGCIYNEDNNIIYQGFMVERKKVCFGKEFYGDNGLIEYNGDYTGDARKGLSRIGNSITYQYKDGKVNEICYIENELPIRKIEIDGETMKQFTGDKLEYEGGWIMKENEYVRNGAGYIATSSSQFQKVVYDQGKEQQACG